MSQARSVIVCGGGIVGLCAAHYLARENFAVTLVERHAEGAEIEILQGSAAVLERDHPKLLVQAYQPDTTLPGRRQRPWRRWKAANSRNFFSPAVSCRSTRNQSRT